MTDGLERRSDAELLKLSLAGDEHAFVLLYERLKTQIFRYAFYMTGSQAAAEEVTQEVFVALLKDGHRYREDRGEVAGFAFGMARNFVRRLRKHERSHEGLPNEETLEKMAASQIEGEDLPAQLIRNQGAEKIRTAVASLPEHYRQVVVLCDLCELTYAQAAARLECAVGTVRSRLSRAHAILARKLKESKVSQPDIPNSGTEECLI